MKKKELENAYSILKSMGHIRYDHTIPKEVIADILCVKLTPNILDYLAPFVLINHYIQEHGFFCKMIDSNIYIYPANMNHVRCKKSYNSSFKKQKRHKTAMQNTDYAELSNEERQRHMHETTKVIDLCNQVNSVLYNYREFLKK